mgnify:CR=1 FL=1
MVRFKIPNMSCGGCAKGVAAAVREVDPRAEVQVSLDRREIAIGSATADADALGRALRDAGWESERLDA